MVNIFQNAAFARGMGFILATSFMTASCAKQELINPTTSVQSQVQGYSGEQLFSGIFLVDGEVATKLPALQGVRLMIEKKINHNPSYASVRTARNKQIISAIRTLDAAYFGELQAAVKSQQFDQIEASVRKGTTLLKAIISDKIDSEQIAKAQAAVKSIDLSKFNFSKEEDVDKFVSAMEANNKLNLSADYNKTANKQMPRDAIEFVFEFDVAVALELAVAVDIAWAAMYLWAAPTSPTSRFEHDAIIKDIALNLAQ